jgi:hypothetical protein
MRQVGKDCERKDDHAAAYKRHTKESSSTHCTFRIVQIAACTHQYRACSELLGNAPVDTGIVQGCRVVFDEKITKEPTSRSEQMMEFIKDT